MPIEGAAPGVAPRRLLSPGEAPGPPLSFEGLSAEKKTPNKTSANGFGMGDGAWSPPAPFPGLGDAAVGRGRCGGVGLGTAGQSYFPIAKRLGCPLRRF